MFVKSKEAKFYIVLEAKSLEEMRNLYGSSIATFHFARPDNLSECGNGKREFSQPECESGISVPGTFKLDHLQPFAPIKFWKFSNFCPFILGGQF